MLSDKFNLSCQIINSSVNILSNGQHPNEEPETIVIDPESTIVELTACRLRTIEGLEGLTKVENLNMRQNLIEKKLKIFLN